MARTKKSGDRCFRPAGAVVELAVLLPFLSFLFVVTVDFSRVFFAKIVVINCARNGAIYASNPNTPSAFTSVQQAALADAGNLSPAPAVNKPIYNTDSDGNPYVEVTVTCTFYSITNFPGIPNSVPLSSTVRMRMNQ